MARLACLVLQALMKMKPIIISERFEYDLCTSRGVEPLLDARFKMDIRLRIQIQQELFGRGVYGQDVQRANERFFRWIWEHKPHRCEETLRPLYNYSAVYCSHILTRGAFPEIATDPRNINLLCYEMHEKWEHGNRKEMRIYNKNLATIEILKNEYQTSQNI
jgi:hypothetical protein